MRSSRLRRSAHADASRRPRARSRSTESIERIFARPFRATMLAAALPIAPFVAPLLPLAIPRNRRGLRRIRSKYADVAPVKPVTNADSFRGEFPERDVTGNSLMAHIGIVWAVVNRLLAAAAKIAKEQGDDAPEVLGLTMWALAFLLDQCTHLHIAGDETNERAADGNVMQRGHHNGIFPLAALAAGGGVVMGEKIPLWSMWKNLEPRRSQRSRNLDLRSLRPKSQRLRNQRLRNQRLKSPRSTPCLTIVALP